MRLGRTAVLTFLNQAVVSVAGFVATFVIARLLGANSLGIYAIAVATLFWVTIPAAAIGTATTKRISEGTDQMAYVAAGVVMNALVATIVGGGILVAGPAVDRYVGANVSELLATIVVADVAINTVFAILNGRKRVALSSSLQAIERLLRTGGQVGLILLSFGVLSLFIGHAVSLLVSMVVGVLVLDLRAVRPTRKHFSRLVDYARYSWLGALKTRAFGWMDTVVLAFFVSSKLIGIYEVSWNLASTLTLVSLAVTRTLFPEFSELSAGDRTERSRIHHYLNEGLVFTGVFVIPGLFGAIILGDRILSIYRPEFTRGSFILVILIVGRGLAVFGTQFLSVVNAIDRPDIAFRINLVFVVINLGLNVVFVWRFGWVGAAVATAVSAAVSLGLALGAVRRLIGNPEIPYGEIGRQFVASAAMTVVLVWLLRVVPDGHYVTVGLVALGACVYTTALLASSTRVRQKAIELVPVRRTR
jgi:O-antigen/teichoic acid export membrane protein